MGHPQPIKIVIIEKCPKLLKICSTHLHEVDNGKAISGIFGNVGDPEVIPLGMFSCVKVCLQPQLILKFPSEIYKHNESHK